MKQIQIVKEKPPKWIWDKVHQMFEVDDSSVIYTYGNTIYAPGEKSQYLDSSVVVHEMEHMRQQSETNGGKDAWWELYFSDLEFRKKQEIEAYNAQYHHFCDIYKDRNLRAKYAHALAQLASSPMYKININYSEALRLIKN